MMVEGATIPVNKTVAIMSVMMLRSYLAGMDFARTKLTLENMG
jgi:hypothetical protein